MSRDLQFAAVLYPHARRLLAIGNGQSLGDGTGPGPSFAPDNVQYYNNKKIFDSSGNYAFNNPTASTLSRVPLTALQRPFTTDTNYPNNIAGESVEIPFVNELTRLSRIVGLSYFDWDASCVAMAGQPFSAVGPGGTQNCYAAGRFETQAFAAMSRAVKDSFKVGCYLFTHGEADALAQTSTATYEADLQFLQTQASADAATDTGQTDLVPLLLTQQSSCPLSFAGSDTTSQAMYLAALANPLIILAGPKYQYTYVGDFTHLTDYRPLGEKYAQVFLAWYLKQYFNLGPGWAPLCPTSVARNNLTVTLTYHVPVAPLLFDTTITPPHQSGQPFAMWSGGNGFEMWDQPLTITAASNTTPIVLTVAGGVPPPAGTIASLGVQGNTNANGVYPFTAIGQNVTLTGSSGNGTYVAGTGTTFLPIGISGAVVSGNTVILTIARAPVTGGTVGYARHTDAAYGSATGGMSSSAGQKFGILRDSDPYAGPTGFKNYNWGIQFEQAIS